jgi:hypothetical protein
LFDKFTTSLTGSHHAHFDGILVASGPDFGRGATTDGARLIDLAPTVMHMLDVPVPDDTDGRVLASLFAASSPPAERAIRYQDARRAQPAEHEVEFTPEDQETIEQRLRALGYIE